MTQQHTLRSVLAALLLLLAAPLALAAAPTADAPVPSLHLEVESVTPAMTPLTLEAPDAEESAYSLCDFSYEFPSCGYCPGVCGRSFCDVDSCEQLNPNKVLCTCKDFEF